jgi:hypothetical protein
VEVCEHFIDPKYCLACEVDRFRKKIRIAENTLTKIADLKRGSTVQLKALARSGLKRMKDA